MKKVLGTLAAMALLVGTAACAERDNRICVNTVTGAEVDRKRCQDGEQDARWLDPDDDDDDDFDFKKKKKKTSTTKK